MTSFDFPLIIAGSVQGENAPMLLKFPIPTDKITQSLGLNRKYSSTLLIDTKFFMWFLRYRTFDATGENK